MDEAAAVKLAKEWVGKLRQDLWGCVLPFWASHSVDGEFGGFFNQLDEDGTIYGTIKHIWMQGRQVWMFARVANVFPTEEAFAAFVAQYPPPPGVVAAAPTPLAAAAPVPLTRAALVQAAKAGADFLLKNAFDEQGHCYFALTREGVPAGLQRKPFSACFMVMGIAEVGRATGDDTYRQKALELLDRLLAWDAAPGGSSSALGKPGVPGGPPLVPLGVPMILLNILLELGDGLPQAEQRAFYAAKRAEFVQRILRHADAKREAVFEGVHAETGEPDLSTPEGRLLNPGHSVEVGWFMLDVAERFPEEGSAPELRKKALDIIEWAFRAGWDGPLGDASGELGTPAKEAGRGDGEPASKRLKQGAGVGTGGLVYFRDALGFSPLQLEANMKLWWPCAESMIAFARAWQATGDVKYLQRFDAVGQWVWEHLRDGERGEWFGYADRTGTVTHRFKAGPYKGCFHVPRTLLYCERTLVAALEKRGEVVPVGGAA